MQFTETVALFVTSKDTVNQQFWKYKYWLTECDSPDNTISKISYDTALQGPAPLTLSVDVWHLQSHFTMILIIRI